MLMIKKLGFRFSSEAFCFTCNKCGCKGDMDREGYESIKTKNASHSYTTDPLNGSYYGINCPCCGNFISRNDLDSYELGEELLPPNGWDYMPEDCNNESKRK